MTLLLVLVGGAVGALARYLTDLGVRRMFDPVLPWGTLVANVAGSFVIGLLAGLMAGAGGLPDWIRVLVGTGFCGALTTYSTFSLETVALAQAGSWRHASINVLSTLTVGLGAVWLGWALGG